MIKKEYTIVVPDGVILKIIPESQYEGGDVDFNVNQQPTYCTSQKPSDLLRTMGMNENNKGYRYLIYILEYLISTDAETRYAWLDNLTKVTYERTAIKFETTWRRVERGIRHELELAFNNTKMPAEIYDYFRGKKSIKPTNGDFLSRAVGYLLSL